MEHLAQAEDAKPAAKDAILRLDPVIFLGPHLLRIILLSHKRTNGLQRMLELRSVSREWKFVVEEALKSQLTLKIFSNFDALKTYDTWVHQYGLGNDDFYKLSQSDPDELIGSGSSLSSHLPEIITNVRKLVLTDPCDMNLEPMHLLTKWASTLTSLTIFTRSFITIRAQRFCLWHWCRPISTMTNLTRLELYGSSNPHLQLRHESLLDLPRLAEVLARLEHFVLDGPVYAKDIIELKRVLGALTPQRLVHLGLYGLDEGCFGELFGSWEHGGVLAASLKSLQLGRTTRTMLGLIVNQFQELECLNCQPSQASTCLGGSCNQLSSYCYYHAPLGLLETFEVLEPLKHLKKLELGYYTRTGPPFEPDPSHLTRTRLPSIRQLNLTAIHLSFITDFPSNFPQIILDTLPALERLNLHDYRREGASAVAYREMEAQFRTVPGTTFSWGHFHDYFPVRLWGKHSTPNLCRYHGCAQQHRVHFIGAIGCNGEEARRRAEARTIRRAERDRMRAERARIREEETRMRAERARIREEETRMRAERARMEAEETRMRAERARMEAEEEIRMKAERAQMEAEEAVRKAADAQIRADQKVAEAKSRIDEQLSIKVQKQIAKKAEQSRRKRAKAEAKAKAQGAGCRKILEFFKPRKSMTGSKDTPGTSFQE